MKGWTVFFILALALLALGFFSTVYSTQKYPNALLQERIYPFQTAGIILIVMAAVFFLLSYGMALKQKT